MASRSAGSFSVPMFSLGSGTDGASGSKTDPVAKIYKWRIEFRGNIPAQVIEATLWFDQDGWVEFYIERLGESATVPSAAFRTDSVLMVKRVGEAEDQRLIP